MRANNVTWAQIRILPLSCSLHHATPSWHKRSWSSGSTSKGGFSMWAPIICFIMCRYVCQSYLLWHASTRQIGRDCVERATRPRCHPPRLLLIQLDRLINGAPKGGLGVTQGCEFTSSKGFRSKCPLWRVESMYLLHILIYNGVIQFCDLRYPYKLPSQVLLSNAISHTRQKPCYMKRCASSPFSFLTGFHNMA